MRVLLATDKFKGSLTANEVVQAIAKGLADTCETDRCPIADGGEGFTATMLAALGGRKVDCDTVDALHRPLKAHYAVTSTGLAVMEMAAASGLELIPKTERDVLQSSTYGTGLMIRDAVGRQDVQRILIGLGGSATNDGGVGMADALGALFLDANDDPLVSRPGQLDRLAAVDTDQMLPVPPIDVACDVDNPVLGPIGATAVFGPQKGADAATREFLEDFLARLIRITGATDLAESPGAGAAGGLGFGLMHFLGARLHPGFDLVSEALDLPARIAAADLVITGEGSLDAQSLSGKGPVGIARLARNLGKPVIALAGHITDEVRQSELFLHCASLSEFDLPLETLMRDAAPLLTRKVQELSDLPALRGEA